MKDFRNLALVIAAVLIISGCATTTSIDFIEPRGTEMNLKEENYMFPVAIALPQKSSQGDTDGYDVKFNIPDPEKSGAMVPAHGKLYVYKVSLTDVDRMARNFFRIPYDKIEALKKGAAVTIEGFSADNAKRMFRAIIGLEKDEEK